MLIGTPQSFQGQKEACESHLNFSLFLKNQWNITSEFLIDTYSTQYDKNLTSWYPSDSKLIFHPNHFGYERVISDAINQAGDLSGYDAVFFARIDLFFLPGLSENFKIFDKLTFPFMAEKHWKNENNRPMLSDMMLWVPKQLFTIFNHNCTIWLSNTRLRVDHDMFNFYSASTIGLWVEEYHSSNTRGEWNQLFYIVNRNRSFSFQYKGKNLSHFDGIWADDMNWPKLDINHCPGSVNSDSSDQPWWSIRDRFATSTSFRRSSWWILIFGLLIR
jgi:hypothetical protein